MSNHGTGGRVEALDSGAAGSSERPIGALLGLLGCAAALVTMVGCPSSGKVRCPATKCLRPSARNRPAKPGREGRPRSEKSQGFDPKRHAVMKTAWHRPRSVAVSPHGKVMAVGGAFGSLQIMRISDGKVLRKLGQGNELAEGLLVRYSRSGDLLASAGHDLNGIRVWDPDTGKLKKEWRSGARVVTKIAVAGDRLLLVGGMHGRVEAYDMATGKRRAGFRMRYRQEVGSLASDDNGMWAAAGDYSGEVEIYNLQSKQRVGRVSAGKRLAAVALAPRGDKLAVALSSGVVRFHNLPFGDRDESLTLRLDGRVETLRFAPDGKILAAAMRDSSVDLFRIDDAKRVGRLRGSGSPVLDISFDRQKGLLAAVELGKGVHLWWKRDVEVSVASGRLRKADRARPKKKRAARAKVPPQLLRRRVVVIRTDFDISRTAVDRRGRFVAATAWPERLALWDSRNGKKLWDRRKPPGHVSFRRMPPGGRRRPVMVTFNPKSSRAFVFGRSNRIYRWNPRSGKNVRYLVNPKGTLEAILFAHDGLSYFALLSNGKVRHYHISGRLQKTFETLQNPFWMAVCPTGDLFATAQGWDELAVHSAASGKKLWQRKSGRLKRYVIKAMKFDSGCNRLLTYHGTGFVRVHDARSGDLIERSLLGFPDEASECAFHPGLRWVACGWARRVQLRSTASGELLVDLRVPVGFPGMVESLYFNMKGDTLLARVGKRAVVVWRFDEGKLAEHGEEKSERPRPPAGARPGERPDIAPGRPEPRVPRIYFPRSRPRRRNKPSLKQGGFDAEDDSKSGSDGEKKRPNEKKK